MGSRAPARHTVAARRVGFVRALTDVADGVHRGAGRCLCDGDAGVPEYTAQFLPFMIIVAALRRLVDGTTLGAGGDMRVCADRLPADTVGCGG
jgi:hypothetical protein